MHLRRREFLLRVGTALFCATGNVVRAGTSTLPKSPPGIFDSLIEKPLAAGPRDLLDLAFDTATAIPLHPHSKDRARAQEAVVVTCLELEQPRRAHTYIESITNWRRGTGYANLAFYCARHGKTVEAQHYIEHASQIARAPDVEDWRRDRIRITIAKTHVWLGQTQQAEQWEAGVTASEASKVARVKAMRANEASFHEHIRALDMLIGSDDFDIIKNALEAYAELFHRFYQDDKRRAQIEDTLKASFNNRPILLRIEMLLKLAGAALEHADRSNALRLLHEAQAMAEAYQWPPRYDIPLKARLAALRARAGDTARARTDAEGVLAFFHTVRDGMVDIDRAGALRPLAEAYRALHDTSAALAIYQQAVEEGVQNPNSRPRAEDLAATCCSMALYAIEPEAPLWERMRQIRQGLGSPW